MGDDRFSRLTWDERLLLEDALATYSGEYRGNGNYTRLAGKLQAELRETLNADEEGEKTA